LINLETSNKAPIDTYPAKDSHSVVVPYSQREHAWTERQDDLTHPQQYPSDTPKGYPHPSLVQEFAAPSSNYIARDGGFWIDRWVE